MRNKTSITILPLRPWSGWLALLASLALSACASVGSSKSPEEQVRQRAAERWQALIAGEFSRAYTYITPGFRAIISPDGYRNRIGNALTWVGSEVVSVNCPEASKCLARLRLDYKLLLPGKNMDKITAHVDETWLLEDGQWWIFQDIQGR